MKKPITATSPARAVAILLAAICIGRFTVGAESQAGLAPEQQQRLASLTARASG
ncbi:MAG: hypothetical protein ABSF51_00825 [Verrucomicrobiota bacterium]